MHSNGGRLKLLDKIFSPENLKKSLKIIGDVQRKDMTTQLVSDNKHRNTHC